MKPFFCFLVLFISLGICAHAHANDFGLVGGNRAFSLEVSSFKARRFQSVIPQKYDYSCGSAALATLLKYHYGIPVSEQEVLDAMYESGDKKKIKAQGFSLLDMKQYLETLGYRADGFRLNLYTLKGAGIPGIVLINTNGYKHFVVLKGMDRTHVMLGDPALGMRKVKRSEFIKMWNQVFFVIRNHAEQAGLSFSHEDGWQARRNKLFRAALSDHALSTLNIHTVIAPGIYY